MNASYKTIGLWVVLIILFVAFYQFFSHSNDEVKKLSWSGFLAEIELGHVKSVQVKGERYRWRNADDNLPLEAIGPRPDQALLQSLRDDDIEVDFEQDEPEGVWTRILSQWLPVVFIVSLFIWFMRRARGKPMTNPLTREFTSQTVEGPVVLEGLDHVRSQLDAAAAAARDGKPGPRRILITGAPGSGKTQLIRAVGADSKLPLFGEVGSQFIELFVGVGAARLRKLFDTAAKAQPCIVAIDDVDAFATRRVIPTDDGRVDERAGTLLELNNWLDGLAARPPKVLFIATTSRPDVLDESFARPGRFDLRLELPPRAGATAPSTAA